MSQRNMLNNKGLSIDRFEEPKEYFFQGTLT